MYAHSRTRMQTLTPFTALTQMQYHIFRLWGIRKGKIANRQTRLVSLRHAIKNVRRNHSTLRHSETKVTHMDADKKPISVLTL